MQVKSEIVGGNMTRYEYVIHKRDLALSKVGSVSGVMLEVYAKIVLWANRQLDIMTIEEAEAEK